MKSGIRIRQMVEDDIDEVVRIENATFSEPFARDLIERYLLQKAYFSWVAEFGRHSCGGRNLVQLNAIGSQFCVDDAVSQSGDIAGYIMYSFVADEVDIVNIAVSAFYRRHGVGKSLMNHMFDHVRQNGAKRVYLDVRPSNLAARKFYERFGFFQIGVRKGYYRNNGEDALVLLRDLR